MRAPIALLVLAACCAATAQVPGYGPTGTFPRYRSGCVRDLQEFIYAVSSAVEVDDVNRLAALYQWKGISNRTSQGLMRRLEAIAARPLMQVVPVYPDAAVDDFLAPPPTTWQAPVGLRLDQTLANGITPSSTLFRLRRDLGCWWVTL